MPRGRAHQGGRDARCSGLDVGEAGGGCHGGFVSATAAGGHYVDGGRPLAIRLCVEVGDFVAAEGGRGAMANSQFALIADMEKLRVEVDVSELDIARLHRDMPCVVIPDAYKDRRYSGHLLWIDPGANYAKATVQVKVRIDNPDDFLRVEGAAQVQFIAGDKPAEAGSAQPPTTDPAGQVSTTQRSPGLWVPAGACRVDAGGQTAKVLVVREGMLRETTVKLGRREGANIEVLDGLAEGQEIAADAQKAKDGQTVQR